MTCQIWSKIIPDIAITVCVCARVLVYCEWECVCMCVSYSPDIWSLLNCSTSSSLSCAVSVAGETTLSTTHDRPFWAEGERERDKEGYIQLTQHNTHTHTHTHTHSKDIIQTTTLYIPGKMLQYIPSHLARQLVKKGGQRSKHQVTTSKDLACGMEGENPPTLLWL